MDPRANLKEQGHFDAPAEEYAKLSFARHYCQLLRGWGIAVQPCRARQFELRDTFTAFEREEDNIHAAQRLIAARIGVSEEWTVLARDFARYASRLLSLRLPKGVWRTWLLLQLDAATRLNDLVAENDSLSDLGLATRALGEIADAVAVHDRCLTLSRKLEDNDAIARDLGNLGILHAHVGELDEAIHCYSEQIAILNHCGRSFELSNAWSNLGLAQSDAGDNAAAMQSYLTAIRTALAFGDEVAEAAAFGNLGGSLLEEGFAAEAESAYERQLHIAARLNDGHGIASALCGLGIVGSRLGKQRESIRLLSEGIRAARVVGASWIEATGLFNYAVGLYAVGQREEALRAAEESAALFDILDAPDVIAVREQLSAWNSVAAT